MSGLFHPQNTKTHDRQHIQASPCGKEYEGSTQPSCVWKLSVARLCSTRLSEHRTVKESQYQTVPHQRNLRAILALPHPGSCAQQGGFTSSHLAPSLRYFYTVLLPFLGRRRNKKAEKHFLFLATI